MEQLPVVGAMNSMQKLCVVQRSKSKHLCEHIRLSKYKGVISSKTIIQSMRTENI